VLENLSRIFPDLIRFTLGGGGIVMTQLSSGGFAARCVASLRLASRGVVLFFRAAPWTWRAQPAEKWGGSNLERHSLSTHPAAEPPLAKQRQSRIRSAHPAAEPLQPGLTNLRRNEWWRGWDALALTPVYRSRASGSHPLGAAVL
jgi:hypothetical protein